MAKLKLLHAPQPLQGLRAWAYAVGAPYHMAHGFPCDGLPDAAADDFQEEMLKRDWDVNGREAMVDTLLHLGTEGHRYRNTNRLRTYAMLWRPQVASFREELRGTVREGGEEAGDAAGTLWRLNAVQADLPGIRSTSLLAFDAARAVMLARAGLMLGWLQEAEAWDFMTDVARDVQRTYTSWRDYGAAFLLSRNVWAGDGSIDAFDTVNEMLRDDGASPWNRLAWAQPALNVPRAVRPIEPGTAMWTLEAR